MAAKSKSDPKKYTKPELRDKIKKKVNAGSKGGKPGQWSARKAQLVAHEYEEEGGDYKKPRDSAQKSLKKWGEEKWRTSDKKQARRPGGTTRYLPDKAWEKLSDDEKAASNRKKQKGSRKGKQFVSNTPAAKKARKKSTRKSASKSTKQKGPKKKSATKRTSSKKESASKK